MPDDRPEAAMAAEPPSAREMSTPPPGGPGGCDGDGDAGLPAAPRPDPSEEAGDAEGAGALRRDDVVFGDAASPMDWPANRTFENLCWALADAFWAAAPSSRDGIVENVLAHVAAAGGPRRPPGRIVRLHRDRSGILVLPPPAARARVLRALAAVRDRKRFLEGAGRRSAAAAAPEVGAATNNGDKNRSEASKRQPSALPWPTVGATAPAPATAGRPKSHLILLSRRPGPPLVTEGTGQGAVRRPASPTPRPCDEAGPGAAAVASPDGGGFGRADEYIPEDMGYEDWSRLIEEAKIHLALQRHRKAGRRGGVAAARRKAKPPIT